MQPACMGGSGMETRFRDRADAGRALARMLRIYAHQPGLIVLALPRGGVPVGYEVARALDQSVCAMTPEPFFAVGLWYEDFSPTTDLEVRDLLARAATPAAGAA